MASRSYTKPNTRPVSPLKILTLIGLLPSLKTKLSAMPLNLEIQAPGMDGLHAEFFQHFWHILGPSVIQEVLTTFSTKRVPSYLNQTLVVLIPKRNKPWWFSFRKETAQKSWVILDQLVSTHPFTKRYRRSLSIE